MKRVTNEILFQLVRLLICNDQQNRIIHLFRPRYDIGSYTSSVMLPFHLLFATPSPGWASGLPKYMTGDHLASPALIIPTPYNTAPPTPVNTPRQSTARPSSTAATIGRPDSPSPDAKEGESDRKQGSGKPMWVYYDSHGEVKRVWRLE